MCVDINIHASTHFSFTSTFTDTWEYATESRVQFNMNFLDSASGYQSAFRL